MLTSLLGPIGSLSSAFAVDHSVSHWLTRRVSQPKNSAVTAASLVFVIFLWGGNNAGTGKGRY
jgi:uncharacterized membrane protein required for colicin V production